MELSFYLGFKQLCHNNTKHSKDQKVMWEVTTLHTTTNKEKKKKKHKSCTLAINCSKSKMNTRLKKKDQERNTILFILFGVRF
jgi:hypothetical protein